MQDYRPGTFRADLEDDQRRQRTKNALGGSGPPVLGKASGQPTPSDGFFRGQSPVPPERSL